MGSFPPQTDKHWIRVLKKLGFEEQRRVGIGGHAKKFLHPTRNTSDYKVQPNFIIIQHQMHNLMSKRIVEELSYFGFTEADIKEKC